MKIKEVKKDQDSRIFREIQDGVNKSKTRVYVLEKQQIGGLHVELIMALKRHGILIKYYAEAPLIANWKNAAQDDITEIYNREKDKLAGKIKEAKKANKNLINTGSAEQLAAEIKHILGNVPSALIVLEEGVRPKITAKVKEILRNDNICFRSDDKGTPVIAYVFPYATNENVSKAYEEIMKKQTPTGYCQYSKRCDQEYCYKTAEHEKICPIKARFETKKTPDICSKAKSCKYYKMNFCLGTKKFESLCQIEKTKTNPCPHIEGGCSTFNSGECSGVVERCLNLGEKESVETKETPCKMTATCVMYANKKCEGKNAYKCINNGQKSKGQAMEGKSSELKKMLCGKSEECSLVKSKGCTGMVYGLLQCSSFVPTEAGKIRMEILEGIKASPVGIFVLSAELEERLACTSAVLTDDAVDLWQRQLTDRGPMIIYDSKRMLHDNVTNEKIEEIAKWEKKPEKSISVDKKGEQTMEAKDEPKKINVLATMKEIKDLSGRVNGLKLSIEREQKAHAEQSEKLRVKKEELKAYIEKI